MIEACGGVALRLPALEIRAAPGGQLLRERLKDLSGYQFLIFVSRNAVQQTLELLDHKPEPLQCSGILAIGQGTAAALQAAGLAGVQSAGTVAASEQLLELPDLQTNRIKGGQVLIIRGTGGRELLAETLRDRGAQVDYLEVYERVPARYPPAVLDELWFTQKPDLMVATSTEGLQNLFDMSGAEQRRIMQETALVVIGKRMSDLALALGFRRAPVIAEETSDQGLFRAIMTSASE